VEQAQKKTLKGILKIEKLTGISPKYTKIERFTKWKNLKF
jgi:hypothetical protein